MFVDTQAYRDGMRQLAAGVSIIATEHDGIRRGLTATAVCSLSDDPPTLIVCVNRSAEAHEPIYAAKRLSVKILGEEHKALAERFAGMGGAKGDARFEHGTWTTLETGAPVLSDALAGFDCRVIDCAECKTHRAFICSVVAIRVRPDASPLLYVDRSFAGLRPLDLPPVIGA